MSRSREARWLSCSRFCSRSGAAGAQKLANGEHKLEAAEKMHRKWRQKSNMVCACPRPWRLNKILKHVTNRLCVGDFRNRPNSSACQRLIFRKRVVWIAVQPALSGLSGCNDRMAGRMSVLAGMPVWGAIAAQRHTARLARAQMDPV